MARRFTVDDAGRFVTMTIPSGGSAGTYLVTWNGHGDALGLWKENAGGSVTLANSFTYGTWGNPTTTVAGGFSDLGFRYQYVGAGDVQWDGTYGLDLLYMHARHLSPALGGFIEPDPAALEHTAYAYAGNGPVTHRDASGLFWYPVMSGDSVSGLAARFHISTASIYNWNRPVINSRHRVLRSGMCLWINRLDITTRSPYFSNGRCFGYRVPITGQLIGTRNQYLRCVGGFFAFALGSSAAASIEGFYLYAVAGGSVGGPAGALAGASLAATLFLLELALEKAREQACRMN